MWTAGELDVWFLDVEQGDAQFIVGPDGRTMLLDLGENVWNRTVHLSQLPGPRPRPDRPCADVVPDPEALPHSH